MSKSGSYSGSCLCGAVAYEFEGEPRVVVNCHCSRCRKATGSTVATWVLVPFDQFRWLRGEDRLKTFTSSEEAQRMFCGTCGAAVNNLSSRRPKLMHLAAGTLDQSPELEVAFHVHVGSKATWHTITDSIPQFEVEPPPPSNAPPA